MSQWGADGYAQHGWSYRQILAHYYPGTTIESRPSIPVRVLLRRVSAEGRARVALAVAVGRRQRCEGCAARRPARGRRRRSWSRGRSACRRSRSSPARLRSSSAGSRIAAPSRSPRPAASSRREHAAARAVRRRASSGSEVPSSWPPAALEAQAVAARSFTLASLGPATAARAFDVYSDTRSQVYGGIVEPRRRPRTPPYRRRRTRSSSTAARSRTTLFSSSSGGRDRLGGRGDRLAGSVSASRCRIRTTRSPRTTTGARSLIDAAAAAKALHLAGPLIDLTPTPGPSGHDATVTAVGPTTRTTLTGTDVRLALGLRSTWFQVGWLTLVPPPAPVVYGRQGTLDGIARGLAGVTLEAKTPTSVPGSGSRPSPPTRRASSRSPSRPGSRRRTGSPPARAVRARCRSRSRRSCAPRSEAAPSPEP